jgi:hypothetical protein
MNDWMKNPKHQIWVNTLLVVWFLAVTVVYLVCYGPPEFESFIARLGFGKEFADLHNALIAYFFQFWKYGSL